MSITMKKIQCILVLIVSMLLVQCKQDKTKEIASERKNLVEYAASFALYNYEGYTLLEVKQPWAGATESMFYVLYTDDQHIDPSFANYPKIQIPIKQVILTSTTHIPALSVLHETESLISFPGLDYISTEEVRSRIDKGLVKELGQNESLDTEVIVNLDPDVVISFAMDGSNKTLAQLEKSGIPILYNGDWTEQSPLGKAEWIKLFGVLYDKQEEATAFFNSIAENYKSIQEQLTTITEHPTVLSGAMYQDVWYLPQGGSWAAMYFKDAKSNYLWSESTGTGSLALSFEEVLDKGKDAAFWINPAQYETIEELLKANPHYGVFDAVKNKKVYSFAPTKGKSGGTIFYELGPLRPDLVLKDVVSILHPTIFPDYSPTFYQRLK